MSKFATLDSLKKKGRGGDDDDDDDETNEYYAGGAGNHGGGSGLNVVGNPGDEDEDSLTKLFDRARRAAREENNALRDDEEFTLLTIYRNGFTVDDGELREPGVPENDEFLRIVAEGRIPPELGRMGKSPNVKIQNKRGENYVPPKFVAFRGGGNSVGGGNIKTQDEDTIIRPVSGADLPEVDEKEPIIRVQIKFPDRSRIVAKFNKHHTVHDLISVIHHSNKVNSQFVLLAPNPPKPVEASEFTKTITEAGLANASVTVSTKV